MITPIRGRKLYILLKVLVNLNSMIRNDNPDKGAEMVSINSFTTFLPFD